MSRIKSCLDALKAKQKKAVIPYIVAGDPWPEATVACMHELVAQGASVIELGVPFSDPMAEGPVIQKAHERALAHKVSLQDVLQMVARFRQRDDKTPVVLMGYANPIVAMGCDEFAARASSAGVDGVLTVDLPPEEVDELNQSLKREDIDSIFLIAPTTSDQRVATIVEQATGYIYYVSLKGVTGAGHLDIRDVEKNIQRIKAKTALPVCVGFGIKDESSARAIAACADGIVVGSALVKLFEQFTSVDTGNSSHCADQSPAQLDSLLKQVSAELLPIARGALSA